jgi:hypothetical protein
MLIGYLYQPSVEEMHVVDWMSKSSLDRKHPRRLGNITILSWVPLRIYITTATVDDLSFILSDKFCCCA